MMKRELTCTRCGGGRLWHVRTVREFSGASSTEFAVAIATDEVGLFKLPTRYGRFELLVCAACGYCQWYARDFAPDNQAPVQPRSSDTSCRECEGRQRFEVLRVREVATANLGADFRVLQASFPRYYPVGYFSLSVCAGCGVTDWFAQEIADLKPERGVERIACLCLRCSGREAWRISRMREADQAQMRVYLGKGWLLPRRAGRMSVEICSACRHTEWFGGDLDELSPDPEEGLQLLERPPPPMGGPYR